MAFDIYGEPLQRGHCEVHPWVHQEYPCSVCIHESQRYEDEKRQEDEYYRAQEEEHYRHLISEECAPWFDPNHPINQSEAR